MADIIDLKKTAEAKATAEAEKKTPRDFIITYNTEEDKTAEATGFLICTPVFVAIAEEDGTMTSVFPYATLKSVIAKA